MIKAKAAATTTTTEMKVTGEMVNSTDAATPASTSQLPPPDPSFSLPPTGGVVDSGSGSGGDVPPAPFLHPPPEDCTAVTEITVPMVCGVGILEGERWILPPDTPAGR